MRQEYIIYGVGHIPIYHERMIKRIEQLDGNFLGYVDRDENKQDNTKKIFPPVYIAEHPEAVIIILSDKIREIAQYIRNNGWNNRIVVYPHFRYPYYPEGTAEDFGEKWVADHREELYSIYNTDDIYTKKLLDEMMYQRSMNEFMFRPFDVMKDFSHINLYFYDEEIASKGDFTLLNCGAYDGDSIIESYEYYGDKMKLAYGFEPDHVNCLKLKKNMENLGILDHVKCIECGVSNKKETLRFDAQNSMESHISETGEEIIQIDTIDNCVNEVIGDLCINMDIEGFEVQAIKGAERLIKTYHPYLAICVYHKWDDFVDVPMAIKAIRDDYDFYIRSGAHPECYAVPRK